MHRYPLPAAGAALDVHRFVADATGRAARGAARDGARARGGDSLSLVMMGLHRSVARYCSCKEAHTLHVHVHVHVVSHDTRHSMVRAVVASCTQ